MLKAVDFFCGAGGLTRGLLDAGIEVILGIDSDDQCGETFETNNIPAKFIHKDIRALSIQELEEKLREISNKELLFVACAPCQPFSKQRTVPKRKEQRTLLGCFMKFVESFQPEYVFVENVPGITKIGRHSTYNRFIAMLEKNNYFYDTDNVDAKDYGVPQTRRRHIVLAQKSAPVHIPKPTHGPGRHPYRTVWETVSHFPAIVAGETHKTIPNHRASALSDLNMLRIRKTPHNGGSRLDWPEDLVLKCHRGEYKGHTDVYGRMYWNRPAPALTCKCHSLSNGRYGHPEQDRAISLREAAALQGFPDKYVFCGKSKQTLGNQIGNAVPVGLAYTFGKAIVQMYNRSCIDKKK